MSKIVKVTNENFEEEIMRDGVVAIVDFYADWCGPCKMFAPIFEQLAEETDGVVFAKVNVDEAEALAIRFGVMSIPTVLAFKNGAEIGRNVGLAGKQKLLDMINS